MKKILITITVNLLLLFGCNSEPIFTDMNSTEFKIIIKGTMENNSTMPWTVDSQAINGAPFQDDSVVLYSNAPGEEHPTKLMMDIAEIRLNGDEISNYRQKIEENLDNGNNFFNGQGVELKTDDPKSGKTYDTVELFIRKMAFDNSRIYEVNGTGYKFLKNSEFVFYEEDVLGFDLNQRQVISYVDSLKNNSGELLSTFPLKISIPGGFTFDRKAGKTVLEIRLNLRNFIKKYEYSFYDEGEFRLVHYYSVSDWIRNVLSGERYTGKNIQAIARVYIEGKVGTVNVGSAAGASDYVIMIPAGEPITDYTIANSARTEKNGSMPCYFPEKPVDPGPYIDAQIDYCLAREKYKYDFNQAVAGCPNLEQYTEAWDNYDDGVSDFYIAPYILHLPETSIFENVPPGEYKLFTASDPGYGALFEDGDFVPLNGGNAITVSAGQSTVVP